MIVNSYFGFKCPKCNTTTDIGAGASICTQCESKMRENTSATPSTANAYCSHCQTYHGLINGDCCPICQKPFKYTV